MLQSIDHSQEDSTKLRHYRLCGT